MALYRIALAPERMVQPKLRLRVFLWILSLEKTKATHYREFELRNLWIYRCSSAAARSYGECNFCYLKYNNY
jgi:hypothetical protein